MSISWMGMLATLLRLVGLVGLVGKMRTALASPTGEPLTQLPLSDQRLLTAPVHWWVAGVRRSSSASNRGRNRARPLGWREPMGEVARHWRRNQFVHVCGFIAILLRCLCGKLVCARMKEAAVRARRPSAQ